MKIKLITVYLILWASATIQAQSMNGLWIVNQVSVGNQIMTPVAKWFRYNNDSTYQASNGWLQNDMGTWEYHSIKKELTTKSINSTDPYGAFKTRFTDHQMIWERLEDGSKVTVTLSRINELPRSPKDNIIGHWELIPDLDTNSSVSNSVNPKEDLLIRWTGTYRKINSDSLRSNGYWYMNAHRPEFHFINFDRKVDVAIFTVTFSDGLMHMHPLNQQNISFTYRRK